MKKRDAFKRKIKDDAEYFVQDNRQYVGNSVMWWGHNGSGYVTDINKAGRYLGSRVRSMRDTDVAWPVAAILEVTTLHVDAQHLPPRPIR